MINCLSGMKFLRVTLLILFSFMESKSECFMVVGPDAPLVSVVGEDLVLPCFIDPINSAVDLTVQWSRVDLEETLVHLYDYHKDKNENQNQLYRGRTSLFKEELQKGNTSLKLSVLRRHDEGDYKCIVDDGSWFDETIFHVTIEDKVLHGRKIVLSISALALIVAVGLIITGDFHHKKEYFNTKKKYAVDVTLDPDTANHYLILSEDGKQVKCGNKEQNLPDTEKRFNIYPAVLGKQGFSSGRFYYEVQVRGKTEWILGVVRESINRKWGITLQPQNGFWTVWLWNGNEYKALAGPAVPLSLKQKVEKVGVFVDYEEGLVSFYDVEIRSHIYSYTHQSFTDKIYPYFYTDYNDGGKNSEPLIILPVNHRGEIPV